MRISHAPIPFLTQQLWRFSAGRRLYIIGFITLFFLANGLTLLEPLIVAQLFNTIQLHGLTSESLPRLAANLALLLAVDLGFWVFHGPARYLENVNAFFARNNFREFLLHGVMHLPASWHVDHHSGDTIDKIEKASGALSGYAKRTFEIIEILIRFIGSYIALTIFNIHASYIILIMVGISLSLIMQFDRKLVKILKELFKKENAIAAKIYDTISNITTVIVLRVENMVLKSIVKTLLAPLRLTKRALVVGEMKWFTVSICSTLTLIIIFFAYLWTQYRAGGVILVGTLYALYGYISRINEGFFRFAYIYNDVLQQRTAMQNVEEVTQYFSDARDVQQITLPEHWQELRIQHLRFSYHQHEGADLHLDNLNLTIRHGEKIALIGDSGAGKTTFLKIIRGLYTPQHIELDVDGMKLPEGFHSIATEVALIPQDPEIFTSTILENITIGIPYEQAEVEGYVNMAQFSEVVNRLPNQYQSSIVERGVNLSGGEKQRLALARGLLASAKKSIILFDEPTSSVDTKNETEIYASIFKTFSDKTIFSSIHRLHLLPQFDRVIFFRGGKIIADGHFSHILKESEPFQLLWRSYKRSQQEMNE